MHELIKRLLTSIIILPIVVYCIYYSGLYFHFLLIFLYIVCFYEIYKNVKKKYFILFSNIVLLIAFFSIYKLRGDSEYNLVFLLWVLSTTFLSDIGGYVVGKTLKGKKLSKISPNKTYSGSLGAIIFSLLGIPAINLFQELFFNLVIIDFFIIKYFLFSILISIICQLGDIYISFLKRKLNIKDTSNLLPGHGGFLDRIDGLIFVLIFVYFFHPLLLN